MLPILGATSAAFSLGLSLHLWSAAGVPLCLLLDAAVSRSLPTACCFLLAIFVGLVMLSLRGDRGVLAFLFPATCE